MYTHEKQHINAKQAIWHSIRLLLSSYPKLLPLNILIALFSFIPIYVSTTDKINLGFGASLILYFFMSILGLFCASTMLSIFEMLRTNQRVSYKAALANTAKKSGKLIISTVIIYIATFLGFMLMFFPAALIIVYAYMTVINIVLNDQGPWEAFINSFKLVYRHWWQTFSVLVIPAAILFFCGSVYQANYTAFYITTFILLLISLPWLNAAIFTQYQNLKAKPVDQNLSVAYRNLLKERPKALWAALIFVLSYAVLFLGAHASFFIVRLMTHSDASVRFLESLHMTIGMLFLPGCIVALPIVLGLYAFFGSQVSRFLWILASILVTASTAYLFLRIFHGHGPIVPGYALKVVVVCSSLLNLFVIISLLTPSCFRWFKKVSRIRLHG